MKSTIISIAVHSSALAVALSVLVGCQKNSYDTEYAGGDRIIRFSPMVAHNAVATKGDLINNNVNGDRSDIAFPADKNFYATAWTSGEETADFGFTKVVSRGTGASQYWITVFESGEYAGKDKEYLWKSGENKTFYAYANLPLKSDAAIITNTAASQVLTYHVCEVALDNLQTDILMACYQNEESQTSGLVPLTFYHPLTSLVFKKGNIDECYSITGISVEGVYPSGKTTQVSTTGPDFVWTKTDGSAFAKSDETQTVSLSSLEVDPSTQQIGTALLLIPQTFASDGSARIVVTLNDGTDDLKLYYPLKGIQLKSGYTNIYTINYGESSPKVEYVDLGLSVKWAVYNLGASSPEEFGDYYSWGELIGHKADYSALSDWIENAFTFPSSNPDESRYTGSWDGTCGFDDCNTPYFDNNTMEDSYSNSKYNIATGKKVLEEMDDAAHATLGGTWRMPTLEECKELIENTNHFWIDNFKETGVSGYVYINKNDENKWIFLPAAGQASSLDLTNANLIGRYWSSSLSVVSRRAEFLSFNAIEGETTYTGYAPRLIGLTIRPVCP